MFLTFQHLDVLTGHGRRCEDLGYPMVVMLVAANTSTGGEVVILSLHIRADTTYCTVPVLSSLRVHALYGKRWIGIMLALFILMRLTIDVYVRALSSFFGLLSFSIRHFSFRGKYSCREPSPLEGPNFNPSHDVRSSLTIPSRLPCKLYMVVVSNSI